MPLPLLPPHPTPAAAIAAAQCALNAVADTGASTRSVRSCAEGRVVPTRLVASGAILARYRRALIHIQPTVVAAKAFDTGTVVLAWQDRLVIEGVCAR